MSICKNVLKHSNARNYNMKYLWHRRVDMDKLGFSHSLGSKTFKPAAISKYLITTLEVNISLQLRLILVVILGQFCNDFGDGQKARIRAHLWTVCSLIRRL